MRVAIVDYGMGNIYSVQSVFRYHGAESLYTSDAKEILTADRILLPGVGSFRKAMVDIRAKGLDKVLEEAVLEKQIPILGICLGMQLLGKSSTEDGYTEGLGFFDGVVEAFDAEKYAIKVPHVGFNSVNACTDSILFEGIENSSDFYFTHSYRMKSHEDACIGYCHHGETFVASFEKENIFGTQFHPEKSQTNGLKLIKNFIEKL